MSDFVDDEAIMSFIEVTEGRVEQAVSLFMENGGAPLHSELPPTAPAAPQNTAASSSNSVIVDPYEDNVRAPIAAKREALFGPDDTDGYHHIPHMHRSGYGGRSQQGYPRPPLSDVHHVPAESHVASLGSNPNSRLAELFKPPLAIMHQAHSMQQVRDAGKAAKKWIMLTINDPSEFGCQVLNRDLWKDEGVVALIKEHFVFIYWGSESNPAREHKSLYPIENFPYFAIIDPITGERMKTWNTNASPAEFMQDVLDFLSRYSLHQNSAAPAAKKKKSTLPSGKRTVTEMSEEEQLELALAASMGQVKAPQEPIVIDDDDMKEVVPMEEDVPEPTNPYDTIVARMNQEPPAGGPDATRIQFRLPDGTRKVRRFKQSDTIRTLFEYIRADVPEAGDKDFELMNFREPLLGRLTETIDEAKLAGASITVDFP
ncbi:hypothetical protein PhCBS80983_g03303 [Powellomyces hirtus]|uniref:UBX domain-containing protein n=1 Tax=Powellomyces hirtus TaxID=109895 RepID=A0A507E267_9FUNG|nr:hypothetical protein PhCBS80983_g03303 [Powellomyces hirtus]